MQASVQKGNHLAAHVALEDLNYHQDTNRVTPSLRIDSGPELEVDVSGAKISAGRLRQLLPIYEERTVDNSLLLEGQRNLQEFFQDQGYFDAQVDFEQSQPDPSRSVIGYTVVRGVRSKLVNIDIAGAHYFDSATVRERLLMTPARFIRYPWGRFSQRLLEQDTNTILDLYRSNGFHDAQVASTKTSDYKGKHGELSVALEVKEGPQWIVHSLGMDGVLPAADAYLRSIVRSIPGEPFSEANIAADRDSILNYFFNNGYQNATFDWTQTSGPVPTQVDLHFVVQPGKQQFLRTIIVRGLTHTRRSLVDRRITLTPGEPLSQVRVSDTQQKLYDLGIFSKVQTAIQNPDGDEDSKIVLFHIDEASRYSFNAGVGAELARIGGGVTTFDAPAGKTAFSPRVSAGISRLDFLGLGHTISLQTLLSTLEKRAGVTYQAPQLLGHQNLSLTFSGLFDDSSDVRTFTSHRLEGSVQLAQKLTRANTIQYRYTIRRVTIPSGTLAISPELVPIFSQPDRAGIISMSFIQDRRDDPIDTRHGYLNTSGSGRRLESISARRQTTLASWCAIPATIAWAAIWCWRAARNSAGSMDWAPRRSRSRRNFSPAAHPPTAPFPIIRPDRAIPRRVFLSAAAPSCSTTPSCASPCSAIMSAECCFTTSAMCIRMSTASASVSARRIFRTSTTP